MLRVPRQAVGDDARVPGRSGATVHPWLQGALTVGNVRAQTQDTAPPLLSGC